jgi:hypothetical protein
MISCVAARLDWRFERRDRTVHVEHRTVRGARSSSTIPPRYGPPPSAGLAGNAYGCGLLPLVAPR